MSVSAFGNELRTLIKKYPLATYFLLAYFISWGSILWSLGPGDVQLRPDGGNAGDYREPVYFIYISMIIGPSIAGIFLTRFLHGEPGLNNLISMMVKWRVPVKWYAAALLIFPLLLLGIFYSCSFISSKYAPSSLVLFGIAIGFMGGFFEETGWSGFALPKLLVRFSMLTSVLILSIMQAFWRLLADALTSIDLYRELYLLHFFLWILALTAFRIIAIWIFYHTHSLLLTQLAFASFTGSQFVLSPASLSGTENLFWYTAFVIGLWMIAGSIIFTDSKTFFPYRSLTYNKWIRSMHH